MSLKNILLHVDDTRACTKRVEAAATLARAHDAHLTGLYVIPPPYAPAYAGLSVPLHLPEGREDDFEVRAAKAKTRFEDMFRTSDLRTEWRCEKGSLLTILSDQARYADMVVVGQEDPDKTENAPSEGLDNLVFECGRPVMFIPCIGALETIGRRVLVAWNARKEAARAAYDSLPVLQAAEAVTVLSVNPKSGPQDHGEVTGADISLYLARHDIKAEAQSVETSNRSVASLLLSRASEAGADLIVMGAYGHSRLRELVLGGTTRDLLRQMPVPVIMSH